MTKNLREQNPLISIGMPIYNEQSHLRKTLDSVLSQDYHNFELIISDNCSNDDTDLICKEYAAKDNRICYSRNHINIGATDNFVKLFELSQGDYFALISGHDIWDKMFLSSCLEILLQDPSVVLCHPQATWINTDDQNLGVIGGILETRGLDRVSRFQIVLWGVVYGYPIYGMIRTSALKQATLGLKVVAPDHILLAELSLIGTFAYIPKPLLYMRRLQDYGSWESYIKKIFNQNISDLSTPELFWQMIAQYVQIINKQLGDGLEKDTLTSFLPVCLLTKYNWILTGLSAANEQTKSGDVEFNHRILDLANALTKSTLQFKKLLTESPTNTELKVQEQIRQEPKKKIIILDGVFFQLYKTGIARVWTSLLKEWAINGFSQHIIVLDRAETAPKIAGVWYRNVPAYDYNNTDSDRQMLQQVCEEEGADLFISTYYTTPTNTTSVFIAYDMIPEVVGENFEKPMWREKHNGIRHASAYITISENTAQDLVKYFPAISSASVTVAHCGVTKTFSPASLQEVNLFKIKYGISKSYFILVGASNGYKNIDLFLQAFSQLPTKQSFEVVITSHGVLPQYEFRSYTSGSNVHILHLSDEELRLAYAGAIALVYPSKYEGFGLPVLEALACGCPVITCPNSSIPEVAGEAAIYVKDDDVNALTNALCDVQKPEVRQTLIKTGIEQAKKFSWSKMAEIVSSALINATLLHLNLRDINLIIFPDWSVDEESLGLEIAQVVKAIATHPNNRQITLLINTNNIDEDDANLLLSSVAMHLLMEEELEVPEVVEISLVGHLEDIQWQALLPRIQGRIEFENEEKELNVGATIPSVSILDL